MGADPQCRDTPGCFDSAACLIVQMWILVVEDNGKFADFVEKDHSSPEPTSWAMCQAPGLREQWARVLERLP